MLRAALLLALLARDGGSDASVFALPTPPALDLPPPGTHVSRTMGLLAGARWLVLAVENPRPAAAGG